MGVSTDAILVYGICMDGWDECSTPWVYEWDEQWNQGEVHPELLGHGPADGSELEFKETVAALKGHPKPEYEGEYEPRRYYFKSNSDFENARSRWEKGEAQKISEAYWGKEGIYSKWKEKAEEDLDGCEVVYHCSDECPMHILGIKASKKRASRGYPVILDPKDLQICLDWPGRLQRMCDLLGIPFREPKWILCSDWG